METIPKDGVIYLPTPTALALWRHEITGQLSDGMWENARPYEHWRFWCALEAHLGSPPRVEYLGPTFDVKTSYNLAALIQYVGDRMINVAKLAEAGVLERGMADYMPSTLEEFARRHADNDWKHDFIAKYAESVTFEQARAFYESKYSMKDLRADLRVIKAAMKSVPH